LGDPVQVLFFHGPVDQRVGFLAHRAIGQDVVRLAGEAERVEFIRLDEAAHRNGPVTLGAELVQLIRLDHDVAAAHLVAAHDLVLGDFAVDGAGLHVLDAAVAFLVELVEMHAAGRLAGRVELYRGGHEADAKVALPVRTRSHW
jgi:hypothetical protein